MSFSSSNLFDENHDPLPWRGIMDFIYDHGTHLKSIDKANPVCFILIFLLLKMLPFLIMTCITYDY